MGLSNDFKEFCNDIQITDDESDKWIKRLEEIGKRLNKRYYDSISSRNHMIIVGSIGRETAIHGVSDWDCIFSLPQDVFDKFDSYDSNGQSALLQEIKKEIQARYPQTDVKGNGQVVVVSFNDGVIELVPGFEQSDGNYKYPDSHDGGSWKTTKPIPEQDAATEMAETTSNHYIYLCQLLRRWKNNIGFKFKGLLIDSLVKKFIDADDTRKSMTFSDYETLIIDLFEFLSKEDADRSYWYALGSNQQISNDDNGKFVKKAKKAFNKINALESDEDLRDAYRELFGTKFAKETAKDQYIAPYEEFAENNFNVDIRYNMKLDCTVTQAGFRPKLLTEFLAKHRPLKANKQLEFKVVKTSIPKSLIASVVWYWKVRNTGDEAKKRNNERGQIVVGGMTKKEHTDFNGEHYVECYAVLGDTLIAKARIDVPINTITGSD